jgi:hypothetical protein
METSEQMLSKFQAGWRPIMDRARRKLCADLKSDYATANASSSDSKNPLQLYEIAPLAVAAMEQLKSGSGKRSA